MKKSAEKESGLCLDLLRSILRYDAKVGKFYWLVDWQKPRAMIGCEAGSVVGEYHRISINYNKYLTHRLAWFYVHGVWPKDQIDHINGNKTDNKIANLRCADSSENQSNTAPRKAKKSKWPKGVSFYPDRGLWRSGIKKNGKSYFLGHYDCPAAAHLAYVIAADEHHGDFARSS
jgi:hypothetical protein